eukprot:CAMPEP_0119315378 /NCGR_PEP_ID=MMETSP1333-20130426/35607_1 /TAXON_ID=418940 /ORGANISM="Scyphosphaera apsteinii, Strain RCC1455" /LENGTH=424 /DNA_ID=CAMNT_0007320719 /DNA_START=30 /DNA_END=1304 /DNA_ORIENTATION=-
MSRRGLRYGQEVLFPVVTTAARSSAMWAAVPAGPPDPILGLVEAFKEDPHPDKVVLAAGTYRTDEGTPWVLPSVKEAEARIVASGLDKEYLGITGLAALNEAARAFALGSDSPALKEGRVCSVQTLSGTGACRLIGEFYKTFLGAGAPFYLPKPSWGNHSKIFAAAGLDVRGYRYWDPKTLGLDLDGMIDDLKEIPDGSAILLHACAHNPTGVDPTPDEWRTISAALKGRDVALFFDTAYQGFASGDAERDAFALRLFEADGHAFALGQSFAKNFGLYGERVGVLSLLCSDPDEAKRVESQLKILVRPMYSSPPLSGARICLEVLKDEKLSAQWRDECATMANRIISMRSALKEALEKQGSVLSWEHVTNQIGMFCYSGLSPSQVDRLRDEFHVYVTRDGRISMAGVTSHNVDYIAAAIHTVTK